MPRTRLCLSWNGSKPRQSTNLHYRTCQGPLIHLHLTIPFNVSFLRPTSSFPDVTLPIRRGFSLNEPRLSTFPPIHTNLTAQQHSTTANHSYKEILTLVSPLIVPFSNNFHLTVLSIPDPQLILKASKHCGGRIIRDYSDPPRRTVHRRHDLHSDDSDSRDVWRTLASTKDNRPHHLRTLQQTTSPLLPSRSQAINRVNRR
jgi:hypothetical protein